MAMTHDYLDYLNEKVDISPANSQEELQAAQVISNLMEQHDVEAHVEEFSAPALAPLVPTIFTIMMFVGVLVSGFGMLVLTLVGIVLALIPAAMSVMRLFGRTVSPTFGPSAQSQNVVAVHRATGPLVTKGSRTIVLVAHYDTPRENFLLTTPLAPYIPLIHKLTVPCSYVVALCAFIQLLGFIPSVARIVIWIVGIVAAVPAMIVAVGTIAERLASCTLGANDNKASVAALLGVLENVRPSGLVPRERPVAPEPAPEVEEDAIEDTGSLADTGELVPSAATTQVAPEPTFGVRHGEEVLKALAILPEDCEIDYVVAGNAPVAETRAEEETAPLEPVVPAAEKHVIDEAEIDEILYSDDVLDPEEIVELDEPFEDEVDQEIEAASEEADNAELEEPVAADDADDAGSDLDADVDSDTDLDAADEPADEPEPSEEPVDEPEATDEPEPGDTNPLFKIAPIKTDPGATGENLFSTGAFRFVMDEGGQGVGPKDSSGLSNLDGAFDPEATRPAPRPERPEAPNDPEWGKSSYRPTLSSVARRATLFDLPDPSQNEVDPLATDPRAKRVTQTSPKPSSSSAPARDVSPVASLDSKAVAAPEPISTLGPDRSSEDKGKKSLFGGLFDRLKKQFKSTEDKGEDDSKSGWLGDDEESPEDEGGLWRGGAAPRAGLRLVGDDEVMPENEEVPSEEDLRAAVLSLGDDALIAHDIWFVALGGSSLDHAGMKAFLNEHRSEIRGSFVVNLDCIGAGALTLLKNEGLENTRRADRRVSRLLMSAASDLHVELEQRPLDWDTTDATPAMRRSLRSVTIRGVDENGLPALSHTADDVPENVSGDQAARVTEIVTEMIRRS